LEQFNSGLSTLRLKKKKKKKTTAVLKCKFGYTGKTSFVSSKIASFVEMKEFHYCGVILFLFEQMGTHRKYILNVFSHSLLKSFFKKIGYFRFRETRKFEKSQLIRKTTTSSVSVSKQLSL